jgi:hypothetical protein
MNWKILVHERLKYKECALQELFCSRFDRSQKMEIELRRTRETFIQFSQKLKELPKKLRSDVKEFRCLSFLPWETE